MSIGALTAQVVLDDPSRIHYGPSDPVRGNIILFYRPHKLASNELFGRLVLDITFHGRTKSKIWRSNGQSTTIYRGRVPLFSITQTIYNDVLKISASGRQYIPFELFFPPSTLSTTYGQGEWKDSTRFDPVQEGMPLPPSMQRQRVTLGSFACFIEYRVGCAMRMDGLQVDMCAPGRDDEAFVHYDSAIGPRPPTPAKQLYGLVRVSNKELMEESARPSGFKEKMKATFSSDFYPTYEFDWKIEAPMEIYNGSPLSVIVRISPRDPSVKREDLVIPPVTLTYLTLEIKSTTYARTERRLWSEQHEHGSTTEIVLQGRADSPGPFIGDNDWTKIYAFDPILIPSSFRTVNIRIDHTAKLKGNFHVAHQIESISGSWSVTVCPPLEDPPPPIDAPSSSGPVAGASNGADSLKHALLGIGVQPSLPRQEQAPAMDEQPPLIDGQSSSRPVVGSSSGADSLKDAVLGLDEQPNPPHQEQAPPMYGEAVDDPPPTPSEKGRLARK